MKEMNILIIGAGGQIGSVLTEALRHKYGTAHIFATDIAPKPALNIEKMDVTDAQMLSDYLPKNKIDVIFHLAAILSAKGEQDPKRAWEINMGGLFNVLENARIHQVKKVFFPSTIAVFGEHIPLQNTPNFVPLEPSTVYGISKVSGELWCKYYFEKYGLDVRSVRYPGVIGYESMPGGGTTDYAVDIFYSEAKNEVFHCFLKPDTTLPMIYMEDCIRATIELMEAPKENITCRTSYNLAGFSFSPAELFREIQKHNPDFQIEYAPDFRQQIAETWPQSIDDSEAQKDWRWKPKYDLSETVEVMVREVRKKMG